MDFFLQNYYKGVWWLFIRWSEYKDAAVFHSYYTTSTSYIKISLKIKTLTAYTLTTRKRLTRWTTRSCYINYSVMAFRANF